MTPDALIVLFALISAFVAVSRDWLSPDVSFMTALCLVAASGVIEPKQAVEGFASTAVVAIGSLYIVAAALRKVGLFAVPDTTDEGERLGIFSYLVPHLPDIDGGADEESSRAPRHSDSWLAVAIVGGIAVLPLFGILRFETAAMVGAVTVIICGLLSPDEARRAVNWELVIVVGAVIGLSRAIVASGALDAVSMLAVSPDQAFGSSLSLAVVLVTVFALTSLTNRKAAASVIPLTFTNVVLLSTGIAF